MTTKKHHIKDKLNENQMDEESAIWWQDIWDNKLNTGVNQLKRERL